MVRTGYLRLTPTYVQGYNNTQHSLQSDGIQLGVYMRAAEMNDLVVFSTYMGIEGVVVHI